MGVRQARRARKVRAVTVSIAVLTGLSFPKGRAALMTWHVVRAGLMTWHVVRAGLMTWHVVTWQSHHHSLTYLPSSSALQPQEEEEEHSPCA